MTIGNWMADRCLEGCTIRVIKDILKSKFDTIRTWGAFKNGKLVDTKTHRYKW